MAFVNYSVATAMDWTTVVILGFALLVGSGNVEGIRKRVFGGQDAEIEDFPYQASLRAGGEHICGGSIISDRHILTAAHCLKNDMVVFGLKVHTGTSSSEDLGNERTIVNAAAHSDFVYVDDESMRHDIAILLLKDPIKFDKYQQKIELPEEDVKDGAVVDLTGWGITAQNPKKNPSKLQFLRTSIVPWSKCKEKLKAPLRKDQVCTVEPVGFGPCRGDSGGPLAANGKVVGIVSWGNTEGEECGTGDLQVYTNVYAHRDFIISTMNNETFNNAVYNFDYEDDNDDDDY